MKILRIQWDGTKAGNLEFRDSYREWQIGVDQMNAFEKKYDSWCETGMPLGAKLIVNVKESGVEPTRITYNFASIKQVMIYDTSEDTKK